MSSLYSFSSCESILGGIPVTGRGKFFTHIDGDVDASIPSSDLQRKIVLDPWMLLWQGSCALDPIAIPINEWIAFLAAASFNFLER